MRYNTNNPVGPDGSNDPRDLNDNAGVIDLVTNSLDEVVNDRLGRPRNTVQAFHNLVIDSKAQVAPTVAAAKDAVNSTADAAIEEMQQTAATLGDDLNNKRYTTYAAMLADPQTRDGVVGIVDGDPDPNLNGWYSWDSGSSHWLRFVDQPVLGSTADRLFKAMDETELPNVAIGFGDTHGAYPLRLMDDGVTEADEIRSDAIRALSLFFSDATEMRSRPVPGVLLAFMDSLGTSPWNIKEDGTSRFSSIETTQLSVDGRDVEASLVARSSDMVMTNAGLVPMYPDMNKVSGWGSSSLEFLSARLKEMFGGIAPGSTYYNGAKGGETSRAIAGRLGSVPMLLTVPGGKIPASGSIPINCSNVLPSSFIRSFLGDLAGVRGTLSSDNSGFTFTRETAGSEVDILGENPFLPVVGPAYRDGIALLWMGKNDITTSDTAAQIAQRTDLSFDFIIPKVNRTLVFGHFGNTDWLGGANSVPKMLLINNLHKTRYGKQYVDTLSYLESNQVWVDTGVVPTSADLAAQQGHCLPPSLTTDGLHFNDALNNAFSEFIKSKITQLGWYS